MDRETKALVLVTYGYLCGLKARGERTADWIIEMYERHLQACGLLDENKVIVTETKAAHNGETSLQSN